MATFRIPLLEGQPQKRNVQLSGVDYELTLTYRQGWVLDITDISGNPKITGIPLVTGANLLDQYQHLGLNGGLYVQTTSNPDAVPTFDNLGADGQLYWVDAT